MNYLQIFKSIFKISFKENLTIKKIKEEGDIITYLIGKDFLKQFIPSLIFLTAFYFMAFQDKLNVFFNIDSNLSNLISAFLAALALLMMYGGYIFDRKESSKAFDFLGEYKKIIKRENKKYKKEHNKYLDSYKYYKHYKSEKNMFYNFLVPLDLLFNAIYIALAYYFFNGDDIYWILLLYILLIGSVIYSNIKTLYIKWKRFEPRLIYSGHINNIAYLDTLSELDLIIMENGIKIYFNSESNLYYIQNCGSESLSRVKLKHYDISRYLKLSYEKFKYESQKEHIYQVSDTEMEFIDGLIYESINKNFEDYRAYFQIETD